MILTELRGWLSCVERSPSLFRTVFLHPWVYVRAGAHGASNFHGAFTDQFILERFWCELRISLNSHKPVSKAYRPKNDNFYLLMTTLRFPF